MESALLKVLAVSLADDELESNLSVLSSFALSSERNTENEKLPEVVGQCFSNIVGIRKVNHRIENYMEVVERYNLTQFRVMFRMGRESFEKLSKIIGNDESFIQKNIGGRPMVPTEKQLMIFLWFAATQDNFIRIGDRFGVAQSTTIECIDRVAKAIVRKVLPFYLKWPNSEECTTIMEDFGKKGLKSVIGAIDGTHISIKAPHKNQENYVNRKGFHSILMQAVCNNKMEFMDCYVGWPGSVHDSRVFENSDINRRIKEKANEMCPSGSYLLGDAAYPLSQRIITPYKDFGNFSEIQKNFNYVHSASRTVIERAFALLKGKFQRLKHMELDKLDRINLIVHAITALHNFCIKHENEEYCDAEIDIDIDEEETVIRVIGSTSKDAQRFRDYLAKKLFFEED